MAALVAVETVLVVLLVVLVAGLLRSHAEILRRLGPEREGERDLVTTPPEAPVRLAGASPAVLAGSTLDGGPVQLDLTGEASAPTLLAFLTSGCTSCAGFWESLGERRLPPEVQVVIVTQGPDRERPRKLRSLAPDGVAVVMSSQAWDEFSVPGAPYFVLVEGEVRGEGVATTWQALSSLVGDAIEDLREAELTGGGQRRARRIDETLAAAGIGPDDPSLYPGAKL
jgi:hypothetical protein